MVVHVYMPVAMIASPITAYNILAWPRFSRPVSICTLYERKNHSHPAMAAASESKPLTRNNADNIFEAVAGVIVNDWLVRCGNGYAARVVGQHGKADAYRVVGQYVVDNVGPFNQA